jgi:CzcA family heavy metal efflux pump
MIHEVLRISLRNRLFVLAMAAVVIVHGTWTARQLPIDVLPDLTRPRVVLITEAPGLAPEEVETLITVPLEAALSGASGVAVVRSASDIGLSQIYVEFDWDADIYLARQIVQERIATVLDDLPSGIRPQMGPVSSLLGQIVLVGMWSEDGTTDPLEVRTLADWVVRKRLLTIPGISQVITMGGGKKQFQVLVDPHLLHKYEVSLADVENALEQSNLNVTGGYLEQSAQELLVRGLGRIGSMEDLEQVVVRPQTTRSVLLRDVARVQLGAQVKRGDSSVDGHPAVVLTIQKQPKADTRELTNQIKSALADVQRSLPSDIRLVTTYEQRELIDHSVQNVLEAIRDGAILVIIVLFLFLFNFRTAVITLTAIPFSILATALVFQWFDLSINVMTLGGLSVALGELVDDAIVGVENIFQRLKSNQELATPLPSLQVVLEASYEVRGAIFMSTLLVLIVFAPLFALGGMEGRLFTPLGIAYLVSILASTVVSLTVTPVLASLLLPHALASRRTGDGPILAGLKWLMTPVIRFSMTAWGLGSMLIVLVAGILVSLFVVIGIGKDFLPPFDEGAMQVNLMMRPGTSLATSTRISRIADQRLLEMVESPDNPRGPLRQLTARTGRAENDEHVMGVNITEYVITLNPNSGKTRDELINLLYEKLEDLPGVEVEVEQPIAHLISHMLSGVTAQIAIKVFGDDLTELRRQADRIERAIETIPGIADPVVEPQVMIPQLRFELRRDQLAHYGLTVGEINRLVETAMQGRVVSVVLQDQRAFDLLVRFDDEFRSDVPSLDRLPIELADGRVIPLSEIARVREGSGPNTIYREDSRRRIVIRVNTRGRDLRSAVNAIRERIEEEVTLPSGYFVVYGGQFEAQESATWRLLGFSLLAVAGVFIVLYSTFPSVSLVLQILIALPAAFLGGVAAIVVSGQTLSVASMVGFISLGGIAARNGILLIGTYQQRIRERGFDRETVLQGSLERLAPVLMTALTTGLGLVPLIIGGHLPGKEILYPVATVMVGGLITSTITEFLIRPGLFWFLGSEASATASRTRELNVLEK